MTHLNKKITISFDNNQNIDVIINTLSEKFNIKTFNITIDNVNETNSTSNTIESILPKLNNIEKNLSRDDIDEYLKEKNMTLDNVNKYFINIIVIEGRLDIIKWFHQNFKSHEIIFTTDAMDYAAQSGHLHIIKWLHENRSEGCTKNAMDWAAKYGYLDIIKWLHANRQGTNEGCTTQAMAWASRKGHLDIVKWLYENRKEGRVSEGIGLAIAYGKVNVLNYLKSIEN